MNYLLYDHRATIIHGSSHRQVSNNNKAGECYFHTAMWMHSNHTTYTSAESGNNNNIVTRSAPFLSRVSVLDSECSAKRISVVAVRFQLSLLCNPMYNYSSSSFTCGGACCCCCCSLLFTTTTERLYTIIITVIHCIGGEVAAKRNFILNLYRIASWLNCALVQQENMFVLLNRWRRRRCTSSHGGEKVDLGGSDEIYSKLISW